MCRFGVAVRQLARVVSQSGSGVWLEGGEEVEPAGRDDGRG